jgi:hypothetical protein
MYVDHVEMMQAIAPPPEQGRISGRILNFVFNCTLSELTKLPAAEVFEMVNEQQSVVKLGNQDFFPVLEDI